MIRYSWTVLLIVAYYCLVTSANGFLFPTYPILWTKSPKEYKFQDSFQSLTLVLESPCDFGPQLLNGTQAYFQKWCKKELESKVYGPLMDMCDSTTTTNPKRRGKRSILGIITAALPVVSWIGKTVFGLGGSSSPNHDSQIDNLNNQITSVSSRITVTEKEIERLNQEAGSNSDKITELEKQQKIHEALILKLAEYTIKLDKKLDTTIERVDSLESWKSELIQKFGSTVTLTSKLTSFFEWSAKEIPEISRNWKSGQINPNKFLTIFSLQSNDDLVQSLKYSKPKSCSINPLTKIAKFYFKKEHKKESIQAYTSHPFKFIERIPDSNLAYTLEYVGPKDVIYAQELDCIVPAHNSILLFPSNSEECKILPDASVSKFWKKSCEPVHYLDPHEVIQIKKDEKDQYIYCYGFKIKIFKRNFTDCPPFVFSLKIDESFRFDTEIDYQHLSSISKENLGFDTDYSLTQKINLHLMPNILKLDIKNDEDFPLRAQCPNSSGNLVIGLSVAGVILAILVIGIIFGIYYHPMKRKRSQRPVKPRNNPQKINNKLNIKVPVRIGNKKANNEVRFKEDNGEDEANENLMKTQTIKQWPKDWSVVNKRKEQFEKEKVLISAKKNNSS